MNTKRDKIISGSIFIGIVLAWIAYLLLSHDPKEPIKKGVRLNSGQMIGMRSDEIREFQSVINQGLPRANKAIENTGSFKPFVVLKNISGTTNLLEAPAYVALPFELGRSNLVSIRNSQGGPNQINVIVAFSPGRVKTPIEGQKAAILIQFLNKEDMSQTVALPYIVNNGSVDYGFLQHLTEEM